MTGRRPGRAGVVAWLLLAAALARAGRAAAGPETAVPVCRTVDGAPAATSESLVVGMRERMAAGDEAGLRKYLDLGQALILRGGHEVEVVERRPGQALVKVRRGPRALAFWTVEQGIACESAAP